MSWAYHAIAVYYLIGQTLLAAALTIDSVYKNHEAELKSHKMPVWVWMVLMHVLIMLWLPLAIKHRKVR